VKDRRIYAVFVTLFFAALMDMYFWSHVLVGDNRMWCSANPRNIGCPSDLGLAITIGIGVLAVVAGLAARFFARRRA
jgi:hypothetical protein